MKLLDAIVAQGATETFVYGELGRTDPGYVLESASTRGVFGLDVGTAVTLDGEGQVKYAHYWAALLGSITVSDWSALVSRNQGPAIEVVLYWLRENHPSIYNADDWEVDGGGEE